MSLLTRRLELAQVARGVGLLLLSGCGSSGSSDGTPAGGEGVEETTGGAPSTGGFPSSGGNGSGGDLGGSGGSTEGAGSGGVLGSAGGVFGNGGDSGSGGSPGGGGENQGSGGQVDPTGVGCDQSVTDANKQVAEEAMRRLFIETDAAAFTEFWADPYLQHNPVAGSGVDTFWSFFESQVAAGNPLYEMERFIGECDLVLFHGSWGTGAMFDMLRVENGKLVEHWDAPSSGLGGMSMTGDPSLSASSKQLVLEFTAHLIAADPAAAGAYLSDSFLSHSGDISASSEFVSWWEGRGAAYTEVHHVIADGEMVFTMTEGTDGGQGYGFYDLYRVVGGQIVEHWDGGRRMEPGASGLGIF